MDMDKEHLLKVAWKSKIFSWEGLLFGWFHTEWPFCS